jgi:hypothetical protein
MVRNFAAKRSISGRTSTACNSRSSSRQAVPNAYIESFSGKFCDGCLNENWFVSLTDAQQMIEAWRNEYEAARPTAASIESRQSLQENCCSLRLLSPSSFDARQPRAPTRVHEPLTQESPTQESFMAPTTETSPGAAPVFHGDVRKDAVLQAYVEAGTVAGAARAGGISRQTFYDWIESDPSFANAVVMCRQELADDLEAEAFKRAREGSDTLLVFLLRAHRPERYRDRHVIEVVSPDVVSRLEQQASAILEACNQVLEDRQLAGLVASTIANRLRKIWAA